jgi:hypothetical protein
VAIDSAACAGRQLHRRKRQRRWTALSVAAG